MKRGRRAGLRRQSPGVSVVLARPERILPFPETQFLHPVPRPEFSLTPNSLLIPKRGSTIGQEHASRKIPGARHPLWLSPAGLDEARVPPPGRSSPSLAVRGPPGKAAAGGSSDLGVRKQLPARPTPPATDSPKAQAHDG